MDVRPGGSIKVTAVERGHDGTRARLDHASGVHPATGKARQPVSSRSA